VTSAGAVSVARALRAVASIYLPASAQGLRLICPVGSQSCARTSRETPRSTHTHVVEDAPGRNEVLRVREHATLLGATPIAIACDAQVEESSSSNFKTRFRAPAASCQ